MFLFLWRRIADGITSAVIDCSPTNLHDGETLGGVLSACDIDYADNKLTSGNVALMKSKGIRSNVRRRAPKGLVSTYSQRHSSLH